MTNLPCGSILALLTQPLGKSDRQQVMAPSEGSVGCPKFRSVSRIDSSLQDKVFTSRSSTDLGGPSLSGEGNDKAIVRGRLQLLPGNPGDPDGRQNNVIQNRYPYHSNDALITRSVREVPLGSSKVIRSIRRHPDKRLRTGLAQCSVI